MNPTNSSTHLRAVHSGGQTGVDRAGLDVAMNLGLDVGGFCPKGRLATDGAIPDKYPLTEIASKDYRERTRLNVASTDGTLVLHSGKPGPGTKLTIKTAQQLNKPLLVIDMTDPPAPNDFAQWLDTHKIEKLNVAGPRESETNPDIYAHATKILEQLCRAAIDAPAAPNSIPASRR